MSETTNGSMCDAGLPLRADVTKEMSKAMRLLNLTVVLLPFLGFVAVVVFLWGRGFHWVDGGLLVGMYVLTAIGIAVGYHRLFTHRAFETNRVVQFVLAVLGSMAVEGPLLKWVAIYRRQRCVGLFAGGLGPCAGGKPNIRDRWLRRGDLRPADPGLRSATWAASVVDLRSTPDTVPFWTSAGAGDSGHLRSRSSPDRRLEEPHHRSRPNGLASL